MPAVAGRVVERYPLFGTGEVAIPAIGLAPVPGRSVCLPALLLPPPCRRLAAGFGRDRPEELTGA